MAMFERVLVLIGVSLLSALAFVLLRNWQMRRASQAAPAHGRPSVLYFRSDSCAPCVMQWRFLQQLQAQYGDQVQIEKIDADLDRAAAERFGIFTLPTTLVVDATGQVKHANYGLADVGKLARQVASIA
jgi:thiol-disulfide isomerase/thioredoxin